jgi:hypothetical protein
MHADLVSQYYFASIAWVVYRFGACRLLCKKTSFHAEIRLDKRFITINGDETSLGATTQRDT